MGVSTFTAEGKDKKINVQHTAIDKLQ